MVRMSKMSKILKYMNILLFAAIRTVARGHELVAQGWVQFEKTCSEVGAGELPQLLQYIKSKTTPTPMTPVKQNIKEEEEEMDVEVKAEMVEKPLVEKPIHITWGVQMVEYRCGNCDITPTRSKLGMDAHMRSVHKEGSVVLLLCISTYNFDSLNRHMKEHN